MRPSNTAVRKQLQKWLHDLRTLAASKEEQKAAANGSQQGSQGGQVGVGQPVAATAAVVAARDASVREHVTVGGIHSSSRPLSLPLTSHPPTL